MGDSALVTMAPTPLAAPPPGASTLICHQPVQAIGVQDRTPLAWSADGSTLAAVAGNSSIFVFTMQASEGAFRMTRLLGGHTHTVKALLFHPSDPSLLVSAGIDGLYAWDLRTGAVAQAATSRAVKEVPAGAAVLAGAHESDVECMCWAFDGSCLVTGSKDNNLKVWDTSKKAWRLLETITGHKAPVLAVRFNAESRKLASAGRDAAVKVWDASTLSPDWRSRRGDDTGITCSLLGTCEGHRGDVVALTWLPSGDYILSGARDNSIRLWSASTFIEAREVFDRKLGVHGKHRADVRRIVVLPAAGPGAPVTITTCSLDGTLRVWRMTTQHEEAAAAASAAVEAASAAGGPIPSGTGLPDVDVDVRGGASAAGGGSEFDIASSGWDDSTKALLEDILGGGGKPADIIKLASSGTDANLITQHFFEGDDGIAEMEFNPKQPIVALGSSANSLVICAFRPDTLPWLERQYDGTLPPGALPPGTNLAPFLQVQAFAGNTSTVTAVALLNEDRTLFAASRDYHLSQYDVASVERRLNFSFGTSVHSLAVSPVPLAGNVAFIFAGGADYSIRAYSPNAADYEPILRAYASRPATSDPMPAYEYEAARYIGHAGRVESIAIHPRGSVMASGGRDWTVLLWDLTRPAPILPLAPRDEHEIPVSAPIARVECHAGHLTSLRFSSLEAGGLLATAGNDHVVKVWRFVPAGMMGSASLAEQWHSGTAATDGHASAISAVAWGRPSAASRDLLVTGSWDCSLKVWHATSPSRARTSASLRTDVPITGDEVTPLHTLTGHTSRITGVDVSTAGDLIVSTSADCSARVWRFQDSFSCVALYRTMLGDGMMTSVSAGDHVFVTGTDTGVLVWPLRATGAYGSFFSAAILAAAAPQGYMGGNAPLPALPGVSAAASSSNPMRGRGSYPEDGGALAHDEDAPLLSSSSTPASAAARA